MFFPAKVLTLTSLLLEYFIDIGIRMSSDPFAKLSAVEDKYKQLVSMVNSGE